MTLALVDPISYSLISIVVGWATFCFCGYGLLSRGHPISYVVLVVSAIGHCVGDQRHRGFDQSTFRGSSSPARRRVSKCRRPSRPRQRRRAAIGSCATPSVQDRYFARSGRPRATKSAPSSAPSLGRRSSWELDSASCLVDCRLRPIRTLSRLPSEGHYVVLRNIGQAVCPTPR